jgi:hypothetical protein
MKWNQNGLMRHIGAQMAAKPTESANLEPEFTCDACVLLKERDMAQKWPDWINWCSNGAKIITDGLKWHEKWPDRTIWCSNGGKTISISLFCT